MKHLDSLVDAWLTAARAAESDLRHAEQAPALFRPEFVEQRQRDHARSMAWARYWNSQRVSA